MIDQLRNPCPEFEDVIRAHFYMKKDRILEVRCQHRVIDWMILVQIHNTTVYFVQFLIEAKQSRYGTVAAINNNEMRCVGGAELAEARQKGPVGEDNRDAEA